MSPKRHSWCRVGIAGAGGGEMHEADGLGVAAAAGAGDAGDGDGDVGMGMRERTLGHGAGDGFADGAVLPDQGLGDAEALVLGRVGVGDEAALDHVGGAGDLGQQRRDQAAGAAFGRGQPQPRARNASSRRAASSCIADGNMARILQRQTERRRASGKCAPSKDREESEKRKPVSAGRAQAAASFSAWVRRSSSMERLCEPMIPTVLDCAAIHTG